MKSEFVFIALPASALIAPSAFAIQYLTVEQAQHAIFPGKSFTAAPVKLTSVQRKAIEQASSVRVLHDEQQVWRVSGGGWFIVENDVAPASATAKPRVGSRKKIPFHQLPGHRDVENAIALARKFLGAFQNAPRPWMNFD